jgi:molecular chaperone DnaK
VTTIDLPYLHQQPDGKIINLTVSLPRTVLTKMVQPLIDKTIKACSQAIEASGKTPGQIDEVLLIGGMTRMPAVQKAVTSLFGRAPVKGIHPEEAVSMGAARQAYDLTTGKTANVLLDVLPHTLSIVAGSRAIPILSKGTTLPAKRQQSFSTTQEGQTSVSLSVVQGESTDPAKNSSLGVYTIQGIIPRARGETQINVEFSVNAGGALTITAQEVNTGKVLKVNVTGEVLDAHQKTMVAPN